MDLIGAIPYALGAIGLVSVLYAFARLSNAILIVPEGRRVVIERLGQYSRTLEPGLHIIKVPIEYPKKSVWSRAAPRHTRKGAVWSAKRVTYVTITERTFDSVSCTGVTEDGVTVELDGTLRYEISDVKRAVYTNDLIRHLNDTIQQATRIVCHGFGCREIFTSDEKINEAMTKYITEKMEKTGVRCTSFFVQSVKLPKLIQTAMQQQIEQSNRNDIERTKKQHEHNLRLDKLQHDQREELKHNEKETANLRAQLERVQLSRESAQKDHEQKVRQMREEAQAEADSFAAFAKHGMTGEDFVRLRTDPERFRALYNSAKLIIGDGVLRSGHAAPTIAVEGMQFARS